MLLSPRAQAHPYGSGTRRTRSTRSRGLASALLASAVSVCLVAAGAPPTPLGVGDRLFPHLGNPGYDVASYDLALTYSGSNTEPLQAVTTIDGWTTDTLERINLDFAHGDVQSVQVDGETADFATAGEDLVITPADPLPRGDWMRVTVRHTSDPVSAKGRDGGWVRTADGLAMANQADAAHLVFPCNDHPSDKAMFTVRVTAPNGYTAVANGLPTDVDRAGRATTWTYRTLHPMATELAQVSIGRSAVLHREGPHGLPVRDVVPAKDREALEPWLKKTPDQIAWMESKVGPYPFETYGVLVADTVTGFELETQTLSLFEKGLFTEPAYPKWYVESIMVHELAHQWFGNSVSPRTWSDLWLNEGHATWYEALYAQEKKDDRTLEARMKAAYGASDRWRTAGGPPGAPKPPAPGQKIGIFRANVYDGAALVLFALREEIGVEAFDRLERTWLTDHRDGTAGTADFVRLAGQVSGRDLGSFFQHWLYDEKTPPMPGHPEWKPVAPAVKAPE
ncbi:MULTISPECIES: M1 family metallopeptidase [Streptomyces]|uniref:Aminopeptidase N n=1 Tax=Streptomyces bobili TaxID=67280 RepID=A0ABZ1QWB6_9ACTN|nr:MULTISPECIES: M1 family metallopeptidase [Streptomyces]QEU68522.1 M1 family peptidase [Streptomyces galilaeus]GGW23020.1 zinc metalloprotease [Streptomyces galilaeus]